MWGNGVSSLPKVFSGTTTKEAGLAACRPLTGNPNAKLIPQETLPCTSCRQWSPQQHQCKIPSKKHPEAAEQVPLNHIFLPSLLKPANTILHGTGMNITSCGKRP